MKFPPMLCMLEITGKKLQMRWEHLLMKTKFKPSNLLSFKKKEEEADLCSPTTAECDNEDILNEEEIEEYQTLLNEQMRESAETILEEMEERDSIRMPKGVKHVLSLGLLLTSAILGIFIVNQIVVFSNEIQQIPAVWRWPAITCVTVFTIIIVSVIALILWKFFRLQRNRQVNPNALKALSERRHLQLIATEKQNEAVGFLSKYLTDYPFDARNRRRLIKLGLKDEEWHSLVAAAEKLQKDSRAMNTDQWIDHFKNGFQKILDTFAKRRIRQYSLKIGSGTALSPISMVDQMIVLYGCTGLIRELLLIYNIRPAWGQSWVILSRGIIHTYLSGVIEGATEGVADAGADAISEFMGDSFSFLTGTIGRAVGSKTAEATLNGILIWRLGKSIILQLQPVR